MSANENQKTVPNALPNGHRFNEFEIKEVIGGGGFGIVYRAWDHLLERTIAIKEYMPISLAMRNEDLSLGLRGERFHKMFHAGLNSFIQEARLLARFNHPGLLHVLRFWEENGTAYMGTLYYSGMTLKEWQLTSPQVIDENWIRQLLPPLFGAINTIHRAGYLHRDISLDNIQIQENQLPVLLDFGSARKEIGNLSDETEIMLKPGFAPIEQYSEESDSEQGPWTDIYALGAVLHTLVTGNPPSASVVRCIEDSYQPLALLHPPGFSLPLLHAIDRALMMKPADRPQSIDELAALIDLPVSEVQELVTAVSIPAYQQPAEAEIIEPTETVVLAVNPAAGAAENVALPLRRRLSPTLMLLSGVALLAVIALTLFLNRGDSDSDVEHAASAGTTPASTSGSAKTATSAPALATVYLKLKSGESVMLNGEVMDVKPSNSGYASLNLAAGEYKIEVQQKDRVHSQTLKIDRAGTWLINPGS
ncbi:serine/threonine protein kinase [Erwiniaceae bacterium BAC15a-03b]|uniref:Serine/threonine protein kinase n=1 Tax=Winslowiella arboricola TaxID=2978220 RepID=A0A9J6Q162_9GAMM|nr:serine/threonine-protein kinase [Winslowiella arboricola]MCU5774865.1 serine/threonine protein kinase [Winslowiella arboricola]MCU5779983.1 serine/threonine protein kinase [Winslowiella arboricola]